MRVTVDLAPDLVQRLRTVARVRHMSMKRLIEHALRRGLTADPEPVRTARAVALPTFSMGEPRPGIDLDHALGLAFDEVALPRRLDDRG